MSTATAQTIATPDRLGSLRPDGKTLVVDPDGVARAIRTLNGTKYYVNPQGNDAADGLTGDTAWKTIDKVNSASLSPGDSVLFLGQYGYDGTLVVKRGAYGRPITYGSYGGGRAFLMASAAHGSYIGVPYVTIQDLYIVGASQGKNTSGIVLESGKLVWVEQVWLKNLDISGFGKRGIDGFTNSNTIGYRKLTIEHCDVHDNVHDGIALTGYWGEYPTTVARINQAHIHHCRAFNNHGDVTDSEHSGSGIHVSCQGGSLIEYCEAYNNGGQNGSTKGGPQGIWMFDSLNTKIRFCESHHNQSGAAGGTRIDGGGFDLDGGVDGCVIEYCYSHDNYGPGYALMEYGSINTFVNNHIRYNISLNDGRCSAYTNGALEIWTSKTGPKNCFIHNNLFLLDNSSSLTFDRSAICYIQGETMQNLNVFNNLFIIRGSGLKMLGFRSGAPQYGTYSHNLYYATGGADASVLPADDAPLTVDPRLRNLPRTAPTVGASVHENLGTFLDQFQLRADSPAVKAGVQIAGGTYPQTDFFGTFTTTGGTGIGPHNPDAVAVPAGVSLVESTATSAGAIDYANPVVHTQAATLTAGDMNKLHVLSGTSFPLKLPSAPSAGDRLRVQVAETSTDVYMIDGNGKTINTWPARTLWAGESAELLYDGTAWSKLSGLSRAMSVTLRLDGSGHITRPAGDYWQLPYNTIVSRSCPDGFFTAASSRVNILRAGSYLPLAEALYYFTEPNGDCELLVLQNDQLNAKTVNKFGYTGAALNSRYPVQPTATKPIMYATGDFVVVRHYIDKSGQIQNNFTYDPQLVGTFTVTEQLSW